jgi:hypothetical protein
MPRVAELSNKEFLKKLKNVVVTGLEKSGIEVEEYSTEPIKGTRLNRITIIAGAFDKMNLSERQNLLWRIIGQSFSPDDQLRISMIIALGSKEAVGV